MNGEIQQASNIVISARKSLYENKEIDFKLSAASSATLKALFPDDSNAFSRTQESIYFLTRSNISSGAYTTRSSFWSVKKDEISVPSASRISINVAMDGEVTSFSS